MRPDDILGALEAYEQFAIGSAALTAALAVALVWRALLDRDSGTRRLERIRDRAAALRTASIAPARNRRREAGLGHARRLVGALRLLRTQQAEKAAAGLAQAGHRGRDAVVLWFIAKLCLPFVFGAAALALLFSGKMPVVGTGAQFAVALGAVIAGAYAPDLWLRNTVTKRRQVMQKGVPDALDLMVICAEAGQSLDGAIKRVSQELGRSAPELAEELALTAIELGLLPDRRTALENLDSRCGLPAIRSVVQTLAQTEKYGTPLSQSLRVLAAEYRDDRMMKAEEKAARLPAILTVPMIIFILPPLFIVLIGPGILRIADLFGRM
jgi:tight adherence protein C